MHPDESYTVLKLITGETILGLYEGEDEKFVKIDYPVMIKNTLIPELDREAITAVPYCPFSESTSFILEKNHIVYIKKLHPSFIPHYKRFVKVYDTALIPAPMDDGPDTVDELKERIDKIDAMRGSSDKLDVDDILTKFVRGNDTKH